MSDNLHNHKVDSVTISEIWHNFENKGKSTGVLRDIAFFAQMSLKQNS